jgi:peptidoglycan hydrolase-like protein with peptidoglycan-binding domain
MIKKNKYLSSGTVKVDGDFGKQTQEAVRVFQDYYDMSVDGVVGKKTWEQLELKEFI